MSEILDKKELVMFDNDDVNYDDVFSDEDIQRGSTGGGWRTYMDLMKRQAFAGDLVSDIGLPGHFSNGKKSCQKIKMIGCLDYSAHKNGNNAKYTRKTCMSCYGKGCKMCCEDGVKREALSVAERMITFSLMRNKKKIMLHHVFVSIPDLRHSKIIDKNGNLVNCYELFKSKEGRKYLQNYARSLLSAGYDIKNDKIVFSGLDKIHSDNKNRCDGGVQFDHPYRFESGLIKAEYEPHFHFIMYGWTNGDVIRKIEAKTGWVIKNKRTIESRYDCYNVAKYILSHAAVYLKSDARRSAEHSIRYFGDCQNSKFKTESVLKYSKTGYDQIDQLVSSLSNDLMKKDSKTKLYDAYKLKTVQYSHFKLKSGFAYRKKTINSKVQTVQISCDSPTSEDYTFNVECNGVNELKRTLSEYVKPTIQLKDNPAISQDESFEQDEESDLVKAIKAYQKAFHPEELTSQVADLDDSNIVNDGLVLEFLQLKCNYFCGSTVQSVDVCIILDPDKNCLCPECTVKMRLLAPKVRDKSQVHYTKIKEFVSSHPDKQTMFSEGEEIFDYYADVKMCFSGLPYYDLDGSVMIDDGVHELPSCLNLLNVDQYSRLIRNHEIQKTKFEYKVKMMDSYTKESRQALKELMNNQIEYLDSSEILLQKPLLV